MLRPCKQSSHDSSRCYFHIPFGGEGAFNLNLRGFEKGIAREILKQNVRPISASCSKDH